MLKLLMLVVFLTSVGCPNLNSLYASSSQLAEELVLRSRKLNLHEHPFWKRIVYYQPHFFGYKSLIDSPTFFLSEEGKTDPQAEIEETIRQLSLNQNPDKEDENVFCRYPARYRWLKTSLKVTSSQWPSPKCPGQKSWMDMMGGERLSLVFSSYYIDNPASMMGHTLLRVHRHKNEEDSSPLLDNAINYAANPTTTNPLIYPLMGLTGLFKGTFGVMRYYIKIQEYNNSESRDLWEYELNLSKTQIKRILFSVWELGPHFIDYYYLDENCSYILLHLLHLADPNFDFTSSFYFFVNPSDTVRAVAETPDLVRTVRYRPSSQSRYGYRFQILDQPEKQIAKDIVNSNGETISRKSYQNRQPPSKAKILDAVLAFIDFQEELAGEKLPQRYQELQIKVLRNRARLKVKSQSIDFTPVHEQPDRGHKTARVGLSAGVFQGRGGFGLFEWRPTLHDYKAKPLGYTEELSILMGRTQFLYDQESEQYFFERFSFIEILSVKQARPLVSPFAWKLNLGTNRTPGCFERSFRCYEQSINGGAGLAFNLSHRRIVGWAMPIASLGHDGQTDKRWFAGVGGEIGSIFKLTPDMRLIVEAFSGWRMSQINEYRDYYAATFAANLSDQWETHITAENSIESTSYSWSLFHYF